MQLSQLQFLCNAPLYPTKMRNVRIAWVIIIVALNPASAFCSAAAANKRFKKT